jgi:hypothetical protein
LDDMPKPKPVAGADTLLLLLTHHWARDESIFRTEDDRLDYAAIDLFLAYTGGRPAEFVHASKGAASQDPLGDDECNSEASDDILDEDLFDGDEDVSDDDDDDNDDNDYTSDSDNEGYTKTPPNKETDSYRNLDSGRPSEIASVGTAEDPVDSSPMEVDEIPEAVSQVVNVEALGRLEEMRKWKALCYEDVRIWIVPNRTRGRRDVLAMEVFLRYHKGVDNKPKP